MKDLGQFVLGETAEAIAVESSADNRLVARALAGQARRALDIFTWDLDRAVYDDAPFLEAVQHLATGARGALIRVLVQDSNRAVKYGHRLINLGQRLTSAIQFRKPGEEFSQFHEAFLVVDAVGLIHRRQADRYEGIADFKAPKQARDLLAFFDEVWAHSEPDPYLRRLLI